MSPPDGWTILVEGESERIALETTARRLGRDLGAGVEVLGGASGMREALVALGGPQDRVAGMCDLAESDEVRGALRASGVTGSLSIEDMEQLGFFVLSEDLEDELIRAVGVDAVIRIIEAEGELRSLRTLQAQAPWVGVEATLQLRRFFGSRSGRKARYAGLLAAAMPLDRTPGPLAGLLYHVGVAPGPGP